MCRSEGWGTTTACVHDIYVGEAGNADGVSDPTAPKLHFAIHISAGCSVKECGMEYGTLQDYDTNLTYDISDAESPRSGTCEALTLDSPIRRLW